MSRSKNFYHGMNLGRVQRSEYDDANLRDLARHDARLGENLRTVERARKVMKKSMEADKQLFIKSGSQVPNKLFPASQGSNSRPGFKTAPLFAQVSPGPKIKRSSVTDMPSDLDRSNKYRGKPAPRSKSYQELVIDTASADTSRVKDSRLLYNKSLEQSMITSGSGKSFIPEQIDTQAKISPQGGSAYSEQSVIFRSDLEATGRSGSDTIRYGKSLSTRDLDRFIEFNSRAKDSEYSDEAERKSNSQATDDDLNGKNKGTDTAMVKDQELNTAKRPPIWETLSTPKYTSMTKSKRSQIEMEFTSTAHRLRGSKSSPVLYSLGKVKPSPTGQGKVTSVGGASLQGRQVDEVRLRNSVLDKSRNDV